MNKDNYCIEFDYSENDEYWHPTIENINSKQEAIDRAIRLIKEDFINGEELYNFRVGKTVKASIPSILADDIIERAFNNAYDKYDDLADDYLKDVTEEQSDELENKLNEVWHEWHEKNNLDLNCFDIEDSQEFTVDDVKRLIIK